jgi:hypothetical protein
MYANRLRQQGKLIGIDEYDTSHAGGLPALSTGGVADGAQKQALDILKEHLRN